MLVVQLATRTVLDRSSFLTATRQLTGERYADGVDQDPSGSHLQDDMSIVDSYSGSSGAMRSSPALFHVGFLVGGLKKEVHSLIQSCQHCASCLGSYSSGDAWTVLLSCSIEQWVMLIKKHCVEESPEFMVEALSQIHGHLCSIGMREEFSQYHKRPSRNGSYLLLPKP